MREANRTLQLLIGTLIITTGPLSGGVKMQVRAGRPVVPASLGYLFGIQPASSSDGRQGLYPNRTWIARRSVQRSTSCFWVWI